MKTIQSTETKGKQPFPYGYILLGLLVGLIGACFLFLNNSFASLLAIAIGIIVIIFSLVLFAQALLDKRRGFLFVCRLAIAIAGITCGILALILQNSIIYIFSNVIYLALIIDGAYKVGAAFHSRKFKQIKFWITAILGGALVVCAFLMSKYEINPSNGTDALHSILTGLLMIADGMINLLYAFFRNSFHTPESEDELTPVKEEESKDDEAEEKETEPDKEDIEEETEPKEEPVEKNPPEIAPMASIFDEDPFNK